MEFDPHVSFGMPPLSVQLCVLVEVQEIEKLCPASTVVGLNVIVAVGATGALTVSVSGPELALAPPSAALVQDTVIV